MAKAGTAGRHYASTYIDVNERLSGRGLRTRSDRGRAWRLAGVNGADNDLRRTAGAAGVSGGWPRLMDALYSINHGS